MEEIVELQFEQLTSMEENHLNHPELELELEEKEEPNTCDPSDHELELKHDEEPGSSGCSDLAQFNSSLEQIHLIVSYHPHKLKLIKRDENLYTCNRCKEIGIGTRYTCDLCNFHVHPNCSVEPPKNAEFRRRNFRISRALTRWRKVFTVVRMNTVYRRVVAKRHHARQIIVERIFVVINVVLEVPSAIFDQLSSHHKTQYILVAMLISFTTLFICTSELVYRGRKARVAWKWRHQIPWLYYASGHRPFGSVSDIVGLLCATLQCIFNAVAYVLYCQGINNPIQIAIMPLVFSFCVMCSKFQRNPDYNPAYSAEVNHLSMA